MHEYFDFDDEVAQLSIGTVDELFEDNEKMEKVREFAEYFCEVYEASNYQRGSLHYHNDSEVAEFNDLLKELDGQED